MDDYLAPTYSFRPRNSARFFEDHKKSHEWRLAMLKPPASDLLYSLTILIPSCSKHKESTDLLIKELDRQKIKYLVDRSDFKDLGTKRQELYWKCPTEYALQIDADDWISGHFAEVVSPYLGLRPNIDCINFLESVIMGDQTTLTRRSMHFPWNGMMLGNQYAFAPTPKSIIRTELARHVEFEKHCKGEDLAFGRDLRPLLKSEINIEEILYYYEYCSDGTATNSQEHQMGGSQ